MKLSIVIVSYNEKEYLPEAIESCMSHGDYEYEIIIGDDGSNDGSIDLIKGYSDNYPNIIKYFIMDRVNVKDIIPSIRVSNVLKRAFEICQGEYITVISGDDVNFRPDRYKEQVDFLDKNNKYYSCYIDYKKFWNDGSEEQVSLQTSLNEKIFWALRYHHISSFVFRRECLKNILERFCDDTGLTYSILVTGKSQHLKMDGFGYRQRDKSIMHQTDFVALSLLDISLLQDCLNCGKMNKESLIHFLEPLKYLKNNKDRITDEKYIKYIENCKKYPNNIIQYIINSNPIIDKYIWKSKFNYHIYKALYKANVISNKGL